MEQYVPFLIALTCTALKVKGKAFILASPRIFIFFASILFTIFVFSEHYNGVGVHAVYVSLSFIWACYRFIAIR